VPTEGSRRPKGVFHDLDLPCRRFFGRLVRVFRNAQGLSQLDLAYQIHEVVKATWNKNYRMSDRDIRRIEAGLRPLSQWLVYGVIQALNANQMDTGLLREAAGMDGAGTIAVELLLNDHPIYMQVLAETCAELYLGLDPLAMDVAAAALKYLHLQSISMPPVHSTLIFQFPPRAPVTLPKAREAFEVLVRAELRAALRAELRAALRASLVGMQQSEQGQAAPTPVARPAPLRQRAPDPAPTDS